MSCSSSQYYKASDVSAELRKNSNKLSELVTSVETDYTEKIIFYLKIKDGISNRENYFIEDLGYRIMELERKKLTFVYKSNLLRKKNDEFYIQLKGLSVLSEDDHMFIKVNDFSKFIKEGGKELIAAFEDYQKSSLGFEQVAFISKKSWKQNRSEI